MLWCNISNSALKASTGRRNLFYWLVVIFNGVDEERRKQLGPDRVCAEWILRNGGSVKFEGESKYLTNYNVLPSESSSLKVKEVDASNSSISHHGFPHFNGCKYIDKLILHNCRYLEDAALKELHYLSNSLRDLDVSSCRSITKEGLKHLEILKNLQQLHLADLPSVDNIDEVIKTLKMSMTKCNIATS